jgi:hypothetical protein
MAGRMTLLARVLPDRWLDVVLQRTFAPALKTAQAAATHRSRGA